MGEMKSAWEIAQERADRLGRLSAEEKQQQERERFDRAGQAVAQKWLDGARDTDVSAQLGKYNEEERGMITRAAIAHLAEGVTIGDSHSVERAERAMSGIALLNPKLQPQLEELGRLIQEYETAERKLRQDLESGYRETLHRMRISGSAVAGINIDADPQWQPAREKIAESFAPGLSELKQALTR